MAVVEPDTTASPAGAGANGAEVGVVEGEGEGEGDPGKNDTGFSLSTETVTGLSPFRIVNVLLPFSRTSKGPS